MNLRNLRLTVISLVAGLLLAGCSASVTSSDERLETPELSLALAQRSAGPPTVEVLEPASGATVSSPFLVRIAVENFTLAPSGRTRDGEGHWHVLSEDGCLAPGTVIPKDASHFHIGSGADSAELDLPPGEHELCVQIGDGFHVAVAITKIFTVTVVD